MPFFLAHFVLSMFILDPPVASHRLRWRLGRILAGLLVFLAVALPWGTVLSLKYHKPTMGETGRYNLSIFGRGSKGPPMHWQGYMVPPHEKALSAWEDPCLFDIRRWSPFQSLRDFLSMGKHGLLVGWEAVKLVWAFWILGLPFLILAALELLRRPMGRPRELAVLVSAFAMWVGGYCMFLVETRYLIVGLVVLVVLAARQMENWGLSQSRPLASKALWATAAILLAWTPIWDLWRDRNAGKWEREQAGSIRNPVLPGTRMASNIRWHSSLSLAYHLGARYYGEAAPEWSSKEISESLCQHRIEVFLLWGKAANEPPPPYLSSARWVAHLDHGPDVYQLK
jgi:hypothetical protein